MATERFILRVESTGTRRVERNVRSIGRAGRRASREMNTLRTALGQLRALLVAVASAAVIGRALSGLVDFSQAMSTVRAVTGSTAKQMQALTSEARRLGETTRFSGTEAAEGMLFLARAGFDVNEVLESTQDVLLLAQAGALELGRAADIASNIMQGFGIATSETARVADVLALASNRANTNVEQLGSAMSFVAPAASSVGIALEETTAAVQALSNAGVQGTRAGTALRTTLIKLEEAGGDLSIQQRGLIPVLETLRDRNIGLSQAAELVGIRQASNLLILVRSIDAIERFTEANNNAEGTVREVAAIMDDNLNGALLRVRSALEAVLLSFGEFGAEGFLIRAANTAAEAFRFLAANIDDAVAAFQVLLGLAIARKLNGIVAALVRLTIITPLLRPFTTLIMLVGGLTASLTLLRDRMEVVEGSGVTLGNVMASAGFVIDDALTSVINSLGGEFDSLGDAFDAFLQLFLRGLTRLLFNVAGAARALEVAFDDLPAAFEAIAIEAANVLSRTLLRGVNLTIRGVNSLLEELGLDTFELLDVNALEIEGTAAGRDMAKAFNQGFDEVILGTVARSRDIAGQVLEAIADPERATLPDALLTTNDLLSGIGAGAGAGTGDGDDDAEDRLESIQRALESLVSSISPLADANLRLAEAQEVINSARELGIDLILSEEEILRRVRREVIGVGNAQVAAAEKAELLNEAFRDGVISADEFNDAALRLKAEGLRESTSGLDGFKLALVELQLEVADTASSVAELTRDVIDDVSTAIADLLLDTETSFTDFLRSLARRFIEFGTRDFLAGASSLVTGVQSGGGGGIGGIVSQLLFGGGGGNNIVGPGTGIADTSFLLGGSGGGGGGFLSNLLGGGIGSLFGFQGGVQGASADSLSVANLPGIDNRLVAFRARSNETVDVNRRGDGGSQGPQGAPIIFNVTTPNADSFQRSQTQLTNRAAAGIQRARKRR